MYKADLNELEQLYQRGVDKNNYQLVPVLNKQGQVQYFAAQKAGLLGKGAFGQVCKAYPVEITPEGVVIQFDKPYAAKFIPDSKYRAEDKEVERLSKYYKNTFAETRVGRQIVIVTEYLPGKELLSETVLQQLKELSLSERTQLIQSILMNFNLMHHYTPATGRAIAHADIKPENVLIDIQRDEKNNRHRVDSAAIDFGIAEETTDAYTMKRTPERKGTPRTIPPEVFSGKGGLYGAKSDVFMISSLLMIVLGVENPYASRDNIPISSEDKSNTRFDMQDLFKDVKLPDLGYDLKSVVIKMIDRMSKLEWSARPDTDEVLRFFSDFHQIALAADHGKISKAQLQQCRNDISASMQPEAESMSFLAHLARMHILANGLWSDVVVDGERLSLMSFPFESFPKIALEIVDLAGKGELNASSMRATFNASAEVHNMASFEKFKLAYNSKKSHSHYRFLNDENKKEIKNPPVFSSLKDVERYIDSHPKSLASRVLLSMKLPKDHLSAVDKFLNVYRIRKARAPFLFLSKEKKNEVHHPPQFETITDVRKYVADHPRSIAASALKIFENQQLKGSHIRFAKK